MIKNYIKIALKVLLRRKFFTFISLFGISFTLMVLMVVTTLVDHTFGERPPETKQDRTLGIYIMKLKGDEGSTTSSPGYKFLNDYVRKMTTPEVISVFSVFETVNTYQNGVRTELNLKRTDGSFWEILDFNFIEGGPITYEDNRDARFVAVINESTRDKLFGKNSAVGEKIEIDGRNYRVTGVVKDVPILRMVPFSDVWIPISTSKSQAYKEQLIGGFMAVLLARSSGDFPTIKAEFADILSRVPIPTEYERFIGTPESFFQFMARSVFSNSDDTGDYSWYLLAVLISFMILFMILPSINLININVSRIMERASEIGVRKTFGASSWTLVGQFVVENVILTLVGAAFGFLLSHLVVNLIAGLDLIPYADFHFNHRIFLYGVLIALFFGIFSGVYPAWKMSRMHPVYALNGRSL